MAAHRSGLEVASAALNTPSPLRAVITELVEHFGWAGATLIPTGQHRQRELVTVGDPSAISGEALLDVLGGTRLQWSGPVPSQADLAPWLGLVVGAIAREHSDASRHGARLQTAGAVLRGFAHDVRNLIGVCLDANKYLASAIDEPGPIDTESMQMDIRETAKALTRIEAYVGKVHQLGHVLQGPWPADRAQTVLGSAVLGQAGTTDSGAQVVVRVAPELPPLPLTADVGSQVVQSLVENACQADAQEISILLRPVSSHDSASLEPFASVVRGLPPGRWVELRCTDNGAGMNALRLQRAHLPLVGKTKDVDRTGLGLTVVNSVARTVGGVLALASGADSSTTVSLFIPAEGTPPAELQPPAVAISGAGIAVAIAVSDPSRRAWFAESLAALKVEVADHPSNAAVLIADEPGSVHHPGGNIGFLYVGEGWPAGMRRPDSILPASADVDALARHLDRILEQRPSR